KAKVAEFNSLASKLDTESAEGGKSANQESAQAEPRREGEVVQATIKTPLPSTPAASAPPKKAPEVNLCDKLKELKSSLPQSPAIIFNLARCAEEEGRTEESVQLFNQYLQLAPNAVDGQDVQLRLEDLSALTKISDARGGEMRKLYAAASRALDDHKYGQALDAYRKADSIL